MSTSAVNLKSAVQQPIIVTHKSLDKQQLIDALNRFDYKDTDEVKVIIPQLNNYFQSIKTHQKCSDYLGAIDILLSELHSNVRVNFYMQFSITNRESSRADKKVEKDSIWVVRLLMQTGFNAQIVTQLETPHTGYNGLGTDEYKYCKKFVTDFNMRIKQVGIIRPREMKSSRVTLINRWTPVTRLQSEPASSTDIVIAASSTNKSSAHPTSSSFPDNVQFEPSQVSGAGQVKCVEGKNCLFTREKEESGNAIALLNATIDTSGTYEFTYIIEKDIGASCCIGLAPESIKDKFSLDAMTHTEDNILFDKTLNSIRSFGGSVYENGIYKEKTVEDFWQDGTCVEFEIVVDRGLAQVYITIKGEKQLEGKAVFSDLLIPLKPFVAFYSKQWKAVYINYGKFTPKKNSPDEQIMRSTARCIGFPQHLQKADWPLNVQFDPTQKFGSITFSQKNNIKWIERDSEQNDIDICFLNCVCSGVGFYQFEFVLNDKDNGTCIGFCLLSELDKFKSEFNTMTTEALFDSQDICILRMQDAKVFNKGIESTIGEHQYIPIGKEPLVFELEVSSDKKTQISMEVAEDSSPNIKNRLAEVDQPVVPFIAFFGKGKQSAMLTEAPIFIPVE